MLKFFFYFLIGIVVCMPTFLFSQNDYLPFFTTDTKAKIIEQPTIPIPGATQTQYLKVHSSIARQTADLPTKIQFNLFEKTVIDVDLDAAIQSHYQGMKVYRGKSNNSPYSQLAHYRDVVIIYNPVSYTHLTLPTIYSV